MSWMVFFAGAFFGAVTGSIGLLIFVAMAVRAGEAKAKSDKGGGQE